jgi:hypothetical protein
MEFERIGKLRILRKDRLDEPDEGLVLHRTQKLDPRGEFLFLLFAFASKVEEGREEDEGGGIAEERPPIPVHDLSW